MIEAHWNELERELPQWLEESRRMAAAGKVATYIPGLAEARPDALGISLCGIRGERVKAGETEEPFTMQSVSKVFSLLLALLDSGEAGVFAKVGKEPTGDDFNSILKLELVDPEAVQPVHQCGSDRDRLVDRRPDTGGEVGAAAGIYPDARG